MSNSALVSYTRLSPNHSGKRTQAVSRITPHCVVGNCSVESLEEVFAKPSRQASSNYGIGVDGRVALFVDEGNRSWCSSSGENDQRAITIECASNNKEPYDFKDAVYASLIELCADICRRNGKTKLLWIPDKARALAYQPGADEMLLTVHRWFAATACPGTWMMEHMADLAEKVTAKLGEAAVETVKPGAEKELAPTEPAASDKEDPEKTIWDYLMGKIGNAMGAAGLMGNLYAESGLKSNNLQNSYNKKLNITDEEYTSLVDGGNYPDFIADKAGYGLAQWTFWSRKQALLDFAKDRGVSIADLNMQLDFMWKKLNDSHPAVLVVLKEAQSVREASDAVLLWYEKPADQSETVQAKRAGYGQGYYDKYTGKPEVKPEKPASKGMSNADCPFLVKVTAKDLRIRKDAGTDMDWTGKYVPVGTYTIVEVKAGKGSEAGWGRLKGGAGWLSLEFCQRV